MRQQGPGGDVDVSRVARLIGDPARAAMLTALVSGRALAAGELARAATIAPATASQHLAKLREGGLVEVVPSGRHRYYRLASADVVHALEALSMISPAVPVTSLRQSRANAAMLLARTCYDHLAGRLGVAVYQSLIAREAFTMTPGDLDLTDVGRDFLTDFGIDLTAVRAKRRQFARPCLDFTERLPHLAGAVGAAICTRMLDLDWLRHRAKDQRSLRVTDTGTHGLADVFGVRLEPLGSSTAG